MATSAIRSVDEYHDPSLDGLIGQSNSIIRGSSHRRNGSQGYRSASDYTHSNVSSHPPPAPDVPRGPPISYRNGGAQSNIPQRSFSQRAKGRPFAREAFADDDHLYDDDHLAYETERLQQNKPYARDAAPAQTVERAQGVAPSQINTSLPRGSSTRQARPLKAQVQESPRNERPHSYQPQYREQVCEPAPQESEPISPAVQSNTLQGQSYMTDEQRRDWAPDRSPLQKLEVTLNDISKEEKRARVEEAEMLLRESKAGRGGRRISREVPTASAQTKGASTRQSSLPVKVAPAASRDLEEAGLVRNLSTTQRDRLQHSTTVESRKPDVRRLSGDGRRGFDYEEQAYRRPDTGPLVQAPKIPQERKTGSVRHKSARQSLPPVTRTLDQGPEDSVSRRSLYDAPQGRRHDDENDRGYRNQETYSDDPETPQRTSSLRQSSAPHSVSQIVPSNITRAVSMQDQKPQAHFPEDREPIRAAPATKNANSSHKAALTGAALGGAAMAVMGRSNSRKLQKAPPPGRERLESQPSDKRPIIDSSPDTNAISSNQAQVSPALNGQPSIETSQRGMPRQFEVQRPSSQRQQEPIGLGLRESPATHQNDIKSPTIDTTPGRVRRPSVSFKEPYNQARPKDEWRQAGVARLTLADISLDEPASDSRDKAWWEANENQKRTSGSKATGSSKVPDRIDDKKTKFDPPLYLRCGPLLRYTGIRKPSGTNQATATTTPDTSHLSDQNETWRGSVMIVTQDSHSTYTDVPTLRLFSQPKRLLPPPPQEVEGEELAPEYIDPIAGLTKLSRSGHAIYVRPVDHLAEEKDLSTMENDNGLFEGSPSPLDINDGRAPSADTANNRTSDQDGEGLGKYQEVRGARLYADPIRDVTFWRFNIEVELSESEQHIAYRINRGPAVGFWVPARGHSMNIMFHSCNGFSMSVNPDQFSGPDPMWRDVLNTHQTRPFHVMIGGGDQVYNDRVMLDTQHFGEWTRIRNPHHKHHAPFTPEMKEELEDFYLRRYSIWFSQGLFSMANAQIPMVNMWDDHDIIDGFGSYPDHFMRNAVFEGLGSIAYKYYLLFQHQTVPEETMADEPSWILGTHPGPYIHHLSRSIYMTFGSTVAFLGLDCRTERKRDEILSLDTYDLVFERCRKEIIEGETKHLIVLLGVPIAYPRLVWLENVLTSRAIEPIKALGRAGFLKGGLLNKFDGGIEILDDLDDHWTSRGHKSERNVFIKDLQDLAAEKSVRITILGGDVHLAAIGQFYSNPKLRIPKDRDHRYMPNVISSAIVNTPPPEMMGDILNKRNKVHHLDHYTDEDMIPMFTHDVDGKKRNNKRLLPRRNWCSIREYHPGNTPPPTPPETPSVSDDDEQDEARRPPQRRFSFSREDVNPRNLMRRLSSRGAPPSSYRDTMNPGDQTNQPRPASLDGTKTAPGQNGFFGPSSTSSVPQRASSASSQQGNRRASSENTLSGPPTRPGFLRRPTNLSEKAARKGNVMAIDKDGNEFDVNGDVDLEGGLDIVINCEVNQKDPSGITTPYRLLVPALKYDGSSDREKLDERQGVGMHRKPTLLGRMGLVGGSRSRAAGNQGAGNWGQESETDSYEGSEGEEQTPRRRFNLFGFRRKKEEYYDDEDDHSGDETHPHEGAQNAHDAKHPSGEPEQHHEHENVATTNNGKQRYTVGTQQPQQSQQPRQQYQQAPPEKQFQQSRRLSFHNQTTSPQYEQSMQNVQKHYVSRQKQQNNEAAYPQPKPQQVEQPQAEYGNRASKQARLLGLDQPDSQFQQPGQVPLRGNGIIGRGYVPPQYPDQSGQRQSSAPPSRGYDGIEAYSEPKARKRWSLRRGGRPWIGDGSIRGVDY